MSGGDPNRLVTGESLNAGAGRGILVASIRLHFLDLVLNAQTGDPWSPLQCRRPQGDDSAGSSTARPSSCWRRTIFEFCDDVKTPQEFAPASRCCEKPAAMR